MTHSALVVPLKPPVAHDEWTGAVSLTFHAGDEIYAQDEDADLFYRIVRGVVRTSHLLADGRRQIGDFIMKVTCSGSTWAPPTGFPQRPWATARFLRSAAPAPQPMTRAAWNA